MQVARTVGLIAVASFLIFMAAVGVQSAPAPAYPQRPVEIGVGYPAGGPVDNTARALAEATKTFFPQPFVVVNKPGAGGMLQASELFRAKPDGYSLGLLGETTLNVQPQVMPDCTFKGVSDFTMVMKAVKLPLVIFVGANTPFKTLKDLLDYAKANPGKIRLGQPGFAATGHVHLLDLAHEAKVKFTDVSYAGAAPAIPAVLGGHVEGAVLALQPAILGNAKAGLLRILATWNAERVEALPDVPTLKELGYNCMTMGSYYTVVGPKGMPKTVVETLYAAFKKGMQTDSYKKYARDNSYILDYKGGEDLTKESEATFAFFTQAIKRWELTPSK